MHDNLHSPAQTPRPLALVITELAPGGAERCLVELATRINRARFATAVYSLAPPPRADRQSLLHRLADSNVPVHFLNCTRVSQYFACLRRLSSFLHEQRADIVQTFLFHANVVGAQAARRAGIARIVTGLRVADPRWWRTAAERFATRHALKHVCVSQSVAEFHRRQGFPPEKLVVIPNGVDISRWQNATLTNLASFGIPPDRKALLFVGRLDKQKALDRFFRELPAIFTALPDHDCLIVGDGPLAAFLQHLARRLGIEQRVHFAGWQTEIPPIMAAAELLVLPSRWEGMANVVLEAMAAAKPVVATQAEGTVELLGLAATQQTAPVDDWPSLSSRIIDIARDESLRHDLGSQNLARAEHFSIDRMVDRYERLYASLFADS